jgi:hypothetical protein
MVLGSIAQPLDVRNRRTYAYGQMKAKPWTEAHKREGYGAVVRAAIEVAQAGDERRAKSILGAVLWSGASEAHLRDGLSEAYPDDHARVDREIRRVRALAEGRLVRETVWRAVSRLGDVSNDFQERAPLVAALRDAGRTREANGDRLVRVTRIRKASPT